MINLNYNLIGAGGYDRNSLEEAKGFIPFQVQYIIVGGGGGSAAGNGSVVTLLSGEAGNGSEVITGSLCVQPFNTYNITVGAGGTGGAISSTPSVFSGKNGVSSSFNTVFAAGGLGGNIQLPTTSSTLAGDGSSQLAQGGNGGSGSVWTYNSSASAAPGDILTTTYFGGGGGGFVIGLSGSASNNFVEYTLSGGTTITGSFLMASEELYQFNQSSSPTGSSTFQSVESTNPIFISVAGQATSSLTLRYAGAQKAWGGSNIFASGGFTYHQFASSSQYEVGNAAFTASYMILGGGGSGGSGGAGVGGGAAGTVKIGTFTLSPTSASYNAVIGQGAAAVTASNNGLQGGSSSIFGVTSTGGNGGSRAYPGAGGSNEFFTGGNLGGGGAGAGSNGGSGANPPPSTLAGNGGNGYVWLDGVQYGPGGYGAYSQGGNRAPQASNGAGVFGNGGFGDFTSGSAGSAGIVAVTYFGPQKATGGTRIVYDGTNTYHYFETNSTLQIIPIEAITAVGSGGYNTGAVSGSSAQPNTGGGAGASYYNASGNNGGSGFVAIRYEGAPIADGGTIITTDKYTYHIYTEGSGSFYAIGNETNNNINPCPSNNIVNWQFNNNTNIVFATASFNASNVAASYTVSGSDTTQNGFSIAEEQIPYTASLSGSGVWPTTGSNSMTIVLKDEFYYETSTQLVLTAAGGNMYLSGSIISLPFIASNGTNWYVSSSVEHIKGNIYNPAVNWKVSNLSPVSTTQTLNGNTASFNIVKDVNVSLVNKQQITGSTNNTFQYDYNFGVTSSLSASIQTDATGSTTMSLNIPETGVTKEVRIFNASNAGLNTITASFVATNNNPYSITGSVVFNKGNLATSSIDWKVTGSLSDGVQSTGSFKIVKDASVNMVNVNDVFQSTGSSFSNDYAFNITASFSGSVTSSWVGATSASIGVGNFVWKSDALGFNFNSISSSVNFTAQFEAQSNVVSYDITASISESIASASLIQTFGKRSGTHYEADVFAIEGLANSGSGIFTSSYATPGNFSKINLLVSGGIDAGNGNINVVNFDSNFFPFPYNPQFNVTTFDQDYNTLVAYWGKPSMKTTGDVATTYISSSNITLHGVSANGTFEYSSSVVPTTGSHLLAETMTVGGGGRGGTKDWANPVGFGFDYIFSGAGGAGGYILANNYFQKGVTYNIVVGAGAPRWDGQPITALTPQSGSDTYIHANGSTIQLSKGGGNGGPVTGSVWFLGTDYNQFGAGGRGGGSAGGGAYIFGQSRTELGAESITGSVSNPFETYGAFEGYKGGDAYSPFRLPSNIPNALALAGGGGGASQPGFDNLATTTTLGAGGLGKYDLSFTMQGVAGGGAGANCGGNSTGSLLFGGGFGQRYTVSGSLDACDGIDGTGGGGGGLISGSTVQPGQAPFNYTTKGGSGKVQIRYVSNVPLASGGTIESGSVSGSNYILHTFTGSGTFTPNL